MDWGEMRERGRVKKRERERERKEIMPSRKRGGEGERERGRWGEREGERERERRKTKWTNQDKKLNIVLFRNNETIVHLLKGNIGEICFCALEHYKIFKQCELSMEILKG